MRYSNGTVCSFGIVKEFRAEVEIEAVSRKVRHAVKPKKVTEIVEVSWKKKKKIQLAFWELLIEHQGIEPEEKL